MTAGTTFDMVFAVFTARRLILLRGANRSAMTEFWNRRTLRWQRFAGGIPVQAWEVTRFEAWELMAGDQLALDFGTLY